MKMAEQIQKARSDPERLEQIFQKSRDSGHIKQFTTAILRLYYDDPEDQLIAAWYFRLQQEEITVEKSRANWSLAVPIGIVTGLIYWWLSGQEFRFIDLPVFLLLWAPIATLGVLIYLTITARSYFRQAVIVAVSLSLMVVYVLFLSSGLGKDWQEDYLVLMVIHLPLLCWAGLGIALLGLGSSTRDRFAFLIRSIEVIITAGLYLGAGVIFSGITIGLFDAINVQIPDVILRLITAGGFGLLPVLTVATIYNPRYRPGEQDFEKGLSKFIAIMMRFFLPLTLAVLLVYVFVIPVNFWAPFQNREVLIVYNVMLFAIMGLLLGVTPMRPEELSPRMLKYLRMGIFAVATLAVLVSVYALSATVYRTLQDRMTINRLAVIGWNSINIGILVTLIYRQIKAKREDWVESLYKVFSWGTNAYIAWGAFLLLAVPLMFR